jgi:predicted KAP-like P-loop ATPase
MDKPLTIFSDKPTREDSLNFRDYADILADIVRVCETPMTVGILGEWGSGKTSLMLMIEDRLGQEGIPTIWFNAWKYDKEDSLWRALILRILEGLKADEEDTKEIYQKLYSTVSSEELGKVQINWLEAGKAITKQGIKAAATIALPVAGIGAVLEKLRETLTGEASLDELSKAISRQTIKTRQDRITSIEEFERLYSRVQASSLH